MIDKYILDTEGLYPHQRETVEALLNVETVSIDIEGNEPRLYTLTGRSIPASVLAEFGKSIVVTHRPVLYRGPLCFEEMDSQ